MLSNSNWMRMTKSDFELDVPIRFDTPNHPSLHWNADSTRESGGYFYSSSNLFDCMAIHRIVRILQNKE